jgi:ATP-binding cassette subfamily C (CFTR/MRP) protein 1
VDLTATNESSGRIMNLVGVDVGEIEGFCCYSHYLWSAPLEIIIAVSLLFMLIGSATFAGVAVMILSMIAGYFISRW